MKFDFINDIRSVIFQVRSIQTRLDRRFEIKSDPCVPSFVEDYDLRGFHNE